MVVHALRQRVHLVERQFQPLDAASRALEDLPRLGGAEPLMERRLFVVSVQDALVNALQRILEHLIHAVVHQILLEAANRPSPEPAPVLFTEPPLLNENLPPAPGAPGTAPGLNPALWLLRASDWVDPATA